MIQLIIRRLLLMIPLLFLISIVIFGISKLQPGDAFTGQASSSDSSSAYYEQQRN
mgnify:FL=1